MNLVVIVKKRTGKTRNGRGFSQSELKETGINIEQAKDWQLPVDKKRKTKNVENTEALKNFLKKKHKKSSGQ
jgi:ribosomal protein L13E